MGIREGGDIRLAEDLLGPRAFLLAELAGSSRGP